MAAQQQVYIPQVQGALPAGTTQYVVQQQPVVYQTQPYTQQQQPQTIIITQPVHVPKITIYQNYRANSARLQGALQLAIGLLSIILTVAGIVTKRTGRTVYENNTFVAAPGIWCAVFYIVAGALTIAASKMKTRGFVISSMVMSILAAVFVWNQIIWSAVGVGIDSTALDEHRHGWNFSYIDTSDVEGTLALACILLVLGFVEFVIAVWTSVLACRVACCCQHNQTTQMASPYAPTTQPVVMYTAGTAPVQAQFVAGTPGLTMASTAIPATAPGAVSVPALPPNYDSLPEKPGNNNVS